MRRNTYVRTYVAKKSDCVTMSSLSIFYFRERRATAEDDGSPDGTEGAAGVVQAHHVRLQGRECHQPDDLLQRRAGVLRNHPSLQTRSHVRGTIFNMQNL